MLNITDIKAEIAALSPETREWLGVDEQGTRRTNSKIHPSPVDEIVWAKVHEFESLLPNMKASNVADATGLDRTVVSRTLKYLVEAGLMTTTGVKSATTYSVAKGVTLGAELPEVFAKPRGRKPAAQVEEVTEETPAPKAANDSAKAPKRKTPRTKSRTKSKAA